MVRVALNGYGKIGRYFHRQILNDPEIEIVAINKRSRIQPELLKYDSVHGRLDIDARMEGDLFVVNGHKIKVFANNSNYLKKWDGVDILIDCTGKNRNYSSLAKHLEEGAQKVILTCPPKDANIKQIVMGVNEQIYAGEKIISNASCTTNALAPILFMIENGPGIKDAYFTTIHSYTPSQNLHDGSHNKDARRARAAGLNLIPASTGASKSIGKVIPSLEGKIQGYAVRVPVPSVSMLDITITTRKSCNDLLDWLEKYDMEGIVGISHEQLVSSDFVGCSLSAIIDAEYTYGKGKHAKVLAWYDNEWGYAARLVDLVKYVSK